jgi:putative flippase GtrA
MKPNTGKQLGPRIFLPQNAFGDVNNRLFREAMRMARFGLVGGAATVTHASMSLLSLNLFALPTLFSNFIGFLCAFLVSLLGHTFFTFAAPMSMKIALKFTAVAIFAVLMSSTVILLAEAFTSLSSNVIVSLAAFSVPIITYSCNSLWTYRSHVHA